MQNFIGKLLVLLALLVGLPLAGIWLTDRPVSPYLKFPPLTSFVRHAPFAWPVFLFLTFFVSIVCGFFLLQVVPSQPQKQAPGTSSRRFPWWTLAGAVLVLAAWVLAWNRFPWFGSFQAYTFLPLWLGYILTVNGLTFRRAGRCLLIGQSRFFLALFPLSALFWWFFEYLNRFAQNWHYLGVEDYSTSGYIVHASLCFSTVLPAVLSTEQYLATFPRLTGPLQRNRIIRLRQPLPLGWAVFVLAGLGLAGIGIWPDYLFPLLWIAPFLIIIAVQVINGEATLFAPLKVGDWRPVWLPALAALVCGFFWEMWNFKSIAHWEYSVPFVQRFHLFEMPVLGYAGYLPFGLECSAVASLLRSCART